MIPTLLTATSVFIIAFIAAPVDMVSSIYQFSGFSFSCERIPSSSDEITNFISSVKKIVIIEINLLILLKDQLCTTEFYSHMHQNFFIITLVHIILKSVYL
jgi:hypothetical protein